MNVRPSHDAVAARLGRGPRFAGMLRGGVVAILVMAAVGLTGCTPGPDPKPTPTPLFTSEADAFKAAEQVYRDYTDALGARNDGDADADPQQYLGGAALDHAIEADRNRKADGLSLVGHTRVDSFQGASADLATPTATVKANVCIDASESRVVDSGGKDVTPPNRAPKALLRVSFAQHMTSWIIADSELVSSQC